MKIIKKRNEEWKKPNVSSLIWIPWLTKKRKIEQTKRKREQKQTEHFIWIGTKTKRRKEGKSNILSDLFLLSMVDLHASRPVFKYNLDIQLISILVLYIHILFSMHTTIASIYSALLCVIFFSLQFNVWLDCAPHMRGTEKGTDGERTAINLDLEYGACKDWSFVPLPFANEQCSLPSYALNANGG